MFSILYSLFQHLLISKFVLIILSVISKLNFCLCRYNPSLSKNYKMDIEHCSKHSIRHSIDCSDPDVVDSFKRLSARWPKFKKKELEDRFEGNPHPVFLMAKSNFNPEDEVWFQKRAVGKNTLGKAVRNLIEGTPGECIISCLEFFLLVFNLCCSHYVLVYYCRILLTIYFDFAGIVIGDRKFTNKTPRRMGISRMAEAQIPTDKGMLVTGHRDVKSYNQYNTNPVKLQMDTCQRIISGDGTKYSEVLSQERKKVIILLLICSTVF